MHGTTVDNDVEDIFKLNPQIQKCQTYCHRYDYDQVHFKMERNGSKLLLNMNAFNVSLALKIIKPEEFDSMELCYDPGEDGFFGFIEGFNKLGHFSWTSELGLISHTNFIIERVLLALPYLRTLQIRVFWPKNTVSRIREMQSSLIACNQQFGININFFNDDHRNRFVMDIGLKGLFNKNIWCIELNDNGPHNSRYSIAISRFYDRFFFLLYFHPEVN